MSGNGSEGIIVWITGTLYERKFIFDESCMTIELYSNDFMNRYNEIAKTIGKQELVTFPLKNLIVFDIS